jgi:PGF-CTERM protein
MESHRLLPVAAGGVALLTLVAAVALPGALASPGEEFERPGRVDVAELAVAPGEVDGATVGFELRTQLGHRGNPAENVTVRYRATDAESGLVVAERTVAVGTVEADGWRAVNATLRVPREGGYDVEATVFRDGEPVDRVRRQVRGVEALTPGYARTSVGFTDQGTLPVVAVSVAEAGEDRTTLGVAVSLTNRGDGPSGELTLKLVARQAESNVVADRVETAVGAIRPGRTQDVETTVSVPTGYNYYLDLALFKDGVLVDSARDVANLDPSERIEADVERREVEFSVEDFEDDDPDRPRREGTVTPSSTPGLGPVAALAALAGAALVARRWSA